MKEKILIVDDDFVLGKLLADILNEAGYQVIHVSNGSEALEQVKSDSFSLILLDLLLPDIDGMDVLRSLIKISPDILVIIMSGHGTIARAVEATKLGAYDFIEKPLEKERVLLTVRNALEKNRLLLSQSLLIDEVFQRYGMVAVSPAMQKIFSLIDRIAPSDSTVLIQGESGSGKELIAHAIHKNSPRARKPFVQVNCAAIPEELIESDLFGHVKGSFTGAIQNKNGKFQQANDGTLFLDEISELSPRAQAKVLRAIETGEVARVGALKSETVNVRLIAATNQNLTKLLEEKKFREDLYHRMNVIPITVPPLRSRPEDILPIANHFIHSFSKKHNCPPKTFSPDAEAVLLSYSWKGNVRELEHFIEKLMLLVDNQYVSGAVASHLLTMDRLSLESINTNTLQKARESFERSFILNMLKSNNWKISRTAQQLGIARTHLYRKIKKLKIKIPS